MTPATLFGTLTRRGFALDAEAGKLLVTPPAGETLTDGERDAIRHHKTALLGLVLGEAPPDPPEGARIVVQELADSSPERPRHMWTWDGAPQWYDAQRWSVPLAGKATVKRKKARSV